MQFPIVSIIIPSYNRAHLIDETLDSIIAQTYANWECIIVDDHSSDSTFKVATDMANKDTRIRVYKRPENRPKGPSACRNFGFEKSKGEYINWFDSDDLMNPKKLEIDLKMINSGNYDFTISQSIFFEHITKKEKGVWNEKTFSSDAINDFIIKKNGWGINSPLWRKKSLIEVGLKFNEKLMTSDDYLYHIQALQFGLIPTVNDEILVKQRVHENRLENFNIKTPYKALVNLYLLNNCNNLNLSKATLVHLNNRSKNILASFFKNKKWEEGVLYSVDLLKNKNSSLKLARILKVIYYGSFYKLFGKGYSFIK